MHKLGCPQRNSLYADCECQMMDMREHTEQLTIYNQAASNSMLVTQLQAELDDNDRWMREVLTDFRIPFDDHKIGRRLAFTQWMADRL